MEAVVRRKTKPRAFHKASEYRPDVGRLVQAMLRDRKILEPFRNARKEMIQLTAGYYYSPNSAVLRNPIPLLSIYQQTISRSLVAKAPRWMLSTFDRRLAPAVRTCQDAMNLDAARGGLADTLRAGVIDALDWLCIFKTHLASPNDAGRLNWGVKAGDCITSRVSPDDFVVDMMARAWPEIGYIGHRYWVPRLVAEAYYRRELPTSVPRQFNAEGDERAASISTAEYINTAQDVEDMTCLWEVLMPRHNCVVTLTDFQMVGPGLDDDGEPLEIKTFVGPPEGCYDILGLGIVADNLMPKAPKMDLRLLDEAANIAFRKMVDTCTDLKEIGLTRGTATETGETIVKANHGEMHVVQDPDSTKQFAFGGKVSQALAGYAEAFKNAFDFTGGNLALLGGRAPQSGTATQDTILNQNAGAGVADFQDQVNAVVTSIGRKKVWYYWNHPSKVIEAPYQVPGVPDARLVRRLHPDNPFLAARGEMTRQGPPPDLRIDPYSMHATTPQERAGLLLKFVQGVYQPLAMVFQSAGLQLDMNFLIGKLGEYWDEPDLAQIVRQLEPVAQATGGGSPGEAGVTSPPGQHEYIRRNVSERDPQATGADVVSRAFGHNLGGDPNGGES